MKPNRRHQGLRTATGRASGQWAAGRRTLQQAPEGPTPGDLFVVASEGDLLVEWVVVDENPEEGHLLVAPADDRPPVDPLDVALDGTRYGGIVCVRPALARWIRGESLAPELRTGRLTPEVLGQLRRALSSAPDTVAFRVRSDDRDPDDGLYLDEIAALQSKLFGPPPGSR